MVGAHNDRGVFQAGLTLFSPSFSTSVLIRAGSIGDPIGLLIGFEVNISRFFQDTYILRGNVRRNPTTW